MSKEVYMLCDVNGNTEKRPIPEGGSSSGNNIFEVSATIDQDTGIITTNNITAAELYEVLSSGKLIKLSLNVSGASISSVICVSGQSENNVKYSFWFNTPDQKMVGDHFSAEDIVVFTPVSE